MKFFLIAQNGSDYLAYIDDTDGGSIVYTTDRSEANGWESRERAVAARNMLLERTGVAMNIVEVA
jgi:hypothetical protein